MGTIELSIQQQEIREKVRQGYAAIAEQDTQKPKGTSCCGPTSCCGADTAPEAEQLAMAVGYDIAEVQALPEGANMGLSCGNPTALAALREGEVVVDLGSGGGFDIFLAGRRVGATGRAIGIDMTPEMLAKARRNAISYKNRTGLENVEFRLGEIEHLPLPDASVDVIISNCVLNLSPDKAQVWREVARVLKPGGRVAISDIALVAELPATVKAMVEALVGCVAGAELITKVEAMVLAAGLSDIGLNRKDGYVDAMLNANDPLYIKLAQQLPTGAKPSDYITSLEVTARKPA